MKTISSYVFLTIEDKNKIEKNSSGNYVLRLNDDFNSKFRKLYNIYSDSISCKDYNKITERDYDKLFFNIETGDFVIEMNGLKKNIKYKISNALSTYYLDIIVNEHSVKENISILEKLNDDLVGDGNAFDEKYISIISYDAISKYYCNKMYPLLNIFERKFRKLLLLTYTSLFQRAYFSTTMSTEIQDKTKKIIKQTTKHTDEETRLKHFLYSLEFSTMHRMLFDKNWCEYDDMELKKFLDKYNDLSKLGDSELRKKFESFHPKSDWERLFFNKGMDDDFENTIKTIGEFRNLVAHCKFFYKKDYYLFSKIIKDTNKSIDKAIKFTETEEFKRLNLERFSESIEKLRKTMLEFVDNVLKIQDLKSSQYFKNFSSDYSSITDKLKKNLNLDKNSNINDEIKKSLKGYNINLK